MFENLIAQSASSLLADDITASRLPPSMLFSGPAASGKLTAALELARVLSCQDGRAEWACACPSCNRHRELSHPDLLLMGGRDCSPEIRAAGAALLRSGAPAARYLFMRAVRKLMLRFDQSFNEGDDPRFAKAASYLADLDERLEELHPSRPLTEDKEALAKSVDAIISRSEKLEEECLSDSIPVNQVRMASSWARLTANGKHKVLIIENADRMQESARNAFLKILEEPPVNVVFILTTSRRGAIMPTILSRVRTYAFIERDLASQQEVITRVFRDTPRENEQLSAYFNRYLPVDSEAITLAAYLFVSGTLDAAIDAGKKPLEGMRHTLDAVKPREGVSRPVPVSAIVAMLNKCKPHILWHLFLARIAAFMRESLRSGMPDAREIALYTHWTDSIREALDAFDVYNISPAAALEKLRENFKERL